MRYRLTVLLGLAVCTASLVAATWAIYHLVRTGTCSSGGPYVSARQCPPGTGGQILALMGGIFGALIGAGIYAARGGHRSTGRVGIGTMLWALGFLMLSGGGLVGAYGPANAGRSDSKLGALIVAIVFVPMALAPLLFALLSRGSDDGGDRWNPPEPQPIQAHPFATLRPAAAPSTPTGPPFMTFTSPTASVGTGPGDSLTRLEQLARLHAEGALTDAEFATAKARLLARG